MMCIESPVLYLEGIPRNFDVPEYDCVGLPKYEDILAS